MRKPIEIYRQSIQYFIQMRVRHIYGDIFLLCELPFMLQTHTHTQNEKECHFSSSFRNFPSIWIIIHDIFIYLACMPFFLSFSSSSGGPLIFCFHNFLYASRLKCGKNILILEVLSINMSEKNVRIV